MSVLFLAGVVPYLIPTAVAAYRDLPNKNAVFLVNLLLGWTVVGWIAALVWACMSEPMVHSVKAPGDEFGPGGLKLQGRDSRLDR